MSFFTNDFYYLPKATTTIKNIVYTSVSYHRSKLTIDKPFQDINS
nr:MAG TPA: hypothetical protein [Bacteriophage sp.]